MSMQYPKTAGFGGPLQRLYEAVRHLEALGIVTFAAPEVTKDFSDSAVTGFFLHARLGLGDLLVNVVVVVTFLGCSFTLMWGIGTLGSKQQKVATAVQNVPLVSGWKALHEGSTVDS